MPTVAMIRRTSPISSARSVQRSSGKLRFHARPSTISSNSSRSGGSAMRGSRPVDLGDLVGEVVERSLDRAPVPRFS